MIKASRYTGNVGVNNCDWCQIYSSGFINISSGLVFLKFLYANAGSRTWLEFLSFLGIELGQSHARQVSALCTVLSLWL